MKVRLISTIATLFIRVLNATLRVRHVNPENMEKTPQYIMAFWHAHILPLLDSRYRRPISVMISQSKDGEYIARVAASYGIDTARGSSTRGGGAALREMLRDVRAGKNVAFTPDGPKGPARVAKEGMIYAAQASGLPIVPVIVGAKKKSSCDRGTACSSRSRSHGRSSSTGNRSPFRATATSRSGEPGSSAQ